MIETYDFGGDVGEVKLSAPVGLAIRWDLIQAAAENELRARAAALGMCWRGKRLSASYQSSKFSALRYGGAVLEELAERGVSVVDISTAGEACLYAMISDLPPAESEVAETAGFTGVEAGSTGT